MNKEEDLLQLQQSINQFINALGNYHEGWWLVRRIAQWQLPLNYYEVARVLEAFFNDHLLDESDAESVIFAVYVATWQQPKVVELIRIVRKVLEHKKKMHPDIVIMAYAFLLIHGDEPHNNQAAHQLYTQTWRNAYDEITNICITTARLQAPNERQPVLLLEQAWQQVKDKPAKRAWYYLLLGEPPPITRIPVSKDRLSVSTS